MTNTQNTQAPQGVDPAVQQQIQDMNQVNGSTIQYLQQQLGAEAGKVGMLNGQLQVANQRLQAADQEMGNMNKRIEELEAELRKAKPRGRRTPKADDSEAPPPQLADDADEDAQH